AAGICQRGVRLIAVPTTLLAMVDSSIGGKTGVNGLRSKNAIGAFWQPSAVLADLATLESLPVPNYRDAFAEVVKYAVAMDKGLFDMLQRNGPRLVERDAAMLERVVFRCVAAKALIVAKDERDRGPPCRWTRRRAVARSPGSCRDASATPRSATPCPAPWSAGSLQGP